ncbi:MAG: hypothetical protein S4CHLAM7_14990 [Chlamydiae bacterium]|nr:hypothetical protein [Chlamydiota bacterium]
MRVKNQNASTELNVTTFSEQLGSPTTRIDNKGYQALAWNPLPKSILQRIIGVSWNSDCPAALSDLTYIQLTHWDFNGNVATGELIFHRKLALEIMKIFQNLFEAQFPIERLELIDNFKASDSLSMAANNSSAFCSRSITGRPGEFSKHSYGTSIDINPLFNPYIKNGTVLPENGRAYLNRDLSHPAMIKENEACYTFFIEKGYTWGGNWDKPYKDFHHFEKDPNQIIEDNKNKAMEPTRVEELTTP